MRADEEVRGWLSRTFKPEDVDRYPSHVRFCEYFVPSEYVLYVLADEQLSNEVEKRLRRIAPNASRVATVPTFTEYDPDTERNLRCPFFSALVE